GNGPLPRCAVQAYQFDSATVSHAAAAVALKCTPSPYTTLFRSGWLSFNSTTRTFSGNPSASDTTPLSIKVTASDGNGGSVSDTLERTITSVNDAPVVSTQTGNRTFTSSGVQSIQSNTTTFSHAD